MAVNACREERSEKLQNQTEMRTVKESLNDGYCDISGHAADMILVGMPALNRRLFHSLTAFVSGDMGKIKVFVTKGEQRCIFVHIRGLTSRQTYPIHKLS